MVNLLNKQLKSCSVTEGQTHKFQGWTVYINPLQPPWAVRYI